MHQVAALGVSDGVNVEQALAGQRGGQFSPDLAERVVLVAGDLDRRRPGGLAAPEGAVGHVALGPIADDRAVVGGGAVDEGLEEHVSGPNRGQVGFQLAEGAREEDPFSVGAEAGLDHDRQSERLHRFGGRGLPGHRVRMGDAHGVEEAHDLPLVDEVGPVAPTGRPDGGLAMGERSVDVDRHVF